MTMETWCLHTGVVHAEGHPLVEEVRRSWSLHSLIDFTLVASHSLTFCYIFVAGYDVYYV